eukprot:scaffold12002_cov117-Skeletonema_dohrnii-CCMP3373.AAC.7
MERANDGYGTENRTLKDEMVPSGSSPGYHMPDAENPNRASLGRGLVRSGMVIRHLALLSVQNENCQAA